MFITIVRSIRLGCAGFLSIGLIACSEPDTTALEVDAPAAIEASTDVAAEITAENLTFKVVEWTDLAPKDDIDALLNPPDYINDIEDGSVADQISSQVTSSIMAASDDRYQRALASTRIIEQMDGQPIKIPGFIVPVEFNDDQVITQFFLVPFFGACLHLPPPPPNQIIFVNASKGITLEALYDPFWVSGVLTTSLVENGIATAAYSMEIHELETYTGP